MQKQMIEILRIRAPLIVENSEEFESAQSFLAACFPAQGIDVIEFVLRRKKQGEPLCSIQADDGSTNIITEFSVEVPTTFYSLQNGFIVAWLAGRPSLLSHRIADGCDALHKKIVARNEKADITLSQNQLQQLLEFGYLKLEPTGVAKTTWRTSDLAKRYKIEPAALRAHLREMQRRNILPKLQGAQFCFKAHDIERLDTYMKSARRMRRSKK